MEYSSRTCGFSSCGSWTLECTGFSSCGFWALEHGVQRGSRVAYAWYFSLQKVQGDSLVILSGRDVTYTPVAAGLLEIHVRALPLATRMET